MFYFPKTFIVYQQVPSVVKKKVLSIWYGRSRVVKRKFKCQDTLRSKPNGRLELMESVTPPEAVSCCRRQRG